MHITLSHVVFVLLEGIHYQIRVHTLSMNKRCDKDKTILMLTPNMTSTLLPSSIAILIYSSIIKSNMVDCGQPYLKFPCKIKQL